MFEIILSILFVSLTFVAIVNLVIASVRNSTFSKDKTIADSEALQAEEWLRSQKDSDWAVFLAKTGSGTSTYCLDTLAWPASAAPCVDRTEGREVNLTKVSDFKVNSQVKVYWTDPKGYHEVTRTTDYSNVSF